MDRRTLLAVGSAAIFASAAPLRAWDGGDPPETAAPKRKKKPDPSDPVATDIKRLYRWWVVLESQMTKQEKRLKKIIDELERRLKTHEMSRRDRKRMSDLNNELKRRYNRMLEIRTGKSAKFVPQRNRNSGPDPFDRAKPYNDKAKKALKRYKAAVKKGDTRTARSALKEAQKHVRTAQRVIETAKKHYASSLNKAAAAIDKAARQGVATDLVSRSDAKEMKQAASKIGKTAPKDADKAVLGIVILN